MKLTPRDAGSFLERPDPACPGILVAGRDPGRSAEYRRRLVKSLIGPEGEAEMRLESLDAGDLRREPSLVLDAVKARGFFSGPRAVLIEGAGDGNSAALAPALAEWQPGDAVLVVIAGDLKSTSSLRKLFESHPKARALTFYDDPPGPGEIRELLAAEGLRDLPPDAVSDLVALGTQLDPGEFRQTLGRISLYKHGDPAPLTPDEIALLAPLAPEADLDELIHATCRGDRRALVGLVARLWTQGALPVGITIALQRQLRLLLAFQSDPQGPEAAMARHRPAFFGRRRDRMMAELRAWIPARLEEACREALALDATLRSNQPVPQRALTERVLLRIAGLARP